ncbi:heme peroxidase [Mycena belliarum]|uniref:Peroxidase n=1 Tax=Mycena belliarum TaxID=1033014 RepID=A0AAD6XIV7_9AGAR|nr:heme peroxidase [Mycena belliae]
MKVSTLSAVSLVAISTVAAANCGKGRTAASGTCCVWYNVLDDIQANLFEGGICGEDAHDALRLSFHDAIGYSPALTRQGKFGGGGADGSLIAFASTELTYASNEGLDDIVHDEKRFADKWGVSYGDIVQFAAAVSVRNCAGGPRIPFLAGRPNATRAAPDGLVPHAADSVGKMLGRVGDAGLSGEELVDLMAAHSIGVQEHVDPTIEGMPFDSTPEIFDTNFYLETLLRGTLWPGSGPHPGQAESPFRGQFRLQSDAALARDPRTACHWQSFVHDQPRMQTRFAAAMAKMALLGHAPAALRALHDCSEVIPASTLPAPRAARIPAGRGVVLEDKCPGGGGGGNGGGKGGKGGQFLKGLWDFMYGFCPLIRSGADESAYQRRQAVKASYIKL